MPIGPKVPTACQGNSLPSGIYNRLYRERIIFLGKDVDDEIANQIIAVMLYLDSEDPGGIYLYINSPGGGHLWHGDYDTMQHIKSVTICVGQRPHSHSWQLEPKENGWRCPTADYDSPALVAWTSNRY